MFPETPIVEPTIINAVNDIKVYIHNNKIDITNIGTDIIISIEYVINEEKFVTYRCIAPSETITEYHYLFMYQENIIVFENATIY